ncbi:MAG: ferrous iron efflux protein F [Methanocella sp. PtaU1.Bin125]|nr:MAG: ferrous iron efflux protein F [Methanocella sp. PtaU1.Bin125]
MSIDIEDMNREKTGIARLSIASNSLLVVTKLVVGFMIGSVSVISEAIHSGIDLMAAVIAYYSVRKSSEPPDSEHTFGHGKYENISGTIEALLIFAAALLIIYEAYQKLTHGVTLEDVNLGIAVMALSAIVNFYVSSRLMKTARRTESIALEADAWHLRTDVLTSLGIFAGLIAIKLTGWTILDPLFAILVALFILKAAFELTIKSVKDLMDVQLPDAEVAEIERIIKDHSGKFAGFHELRTRRSGSDRFVDLHLVVSRDMSVEQAHGLADHIEHDITVRFPRTSVITHVEPCDNGQTCKGCQAVECSKYVAMPEEA